jgi:AraC-like DNA-binding protein
LLSPVFVSLFMSVALMGDRSKFSAPRLFLSKFMLLTGIIFFSHFLYFAPYTDLYIFFDIPLMFIGLLIFPVYHIYFRLLTVDTKFSFSEHSKYMIAPAAVALIYAAAVILTPGDEYRAWLFQEPADLSSWYIRFLFMARKLISLTMFTQLIIILLANNKLIRKYGDRVEQYYSDVPDGKNRNAKMLNLSILAAGVFSFVILIIGRYFIFSKDLIIDSVMAVFAILLFIMGNLGIRQNPLNPTFEPPGPLEESASGSEVLNTIRESLTEKILDEFETNKLYLRSDLNIMDVVKSTGSNRSYVSYVINNTFSQNFNSFVNGYRIRELEKVISYNPLIPNEHLAEQCGFGSVITMKRAVEAKTGNSFSSHRNNIIRERAKL